MLSALTVVAERSDGGKLRVTCPSWSDTIARPTFVRARPADRLEIDGLPYRNDLVLVVAFGIDWNGDKHPLGLVERATENSAVVQALIDNLIAASSTPSYAARRAFVR